MGMMEQLKSMTKMVGEGLQGKAVEFTPVAIAPTSLWYYAKDGQTLGPIPFEQLQDLAATGALASADLVFAPGAGQWIAASAVPSIFAAKILPVATLDVATPMPPALPPARSWERPAATPMPVAPSVVPPFTPTAVPPPMMSPRSWERPVGTPPPAMSSAFPQMPVGLGSSLKQVAVTYQGGHAELLDSVVGILAMEATALAFLGADGTRHFEVPFKCIAEILDPQPGAFPRDMVQKAESLKSTAKAVSMASGAMGFLSKVSGYSGEEGDGTGGASAFSAAGFLGGAGALAANMMTEQANLGTTPRNRLHVVFWKQGVKHRMLFDVRDGKSAADLEDRCLAFWRQTATSRSQFAKASGAPADEE